MEKKTIGEMARGAAVNASTLRYYESIGLLLPTERENGQRRYNDEAEKRLSVIQFAKQVGFTLKEIETLMDGFSEDMAPSERWKAMAVDKLKEIKETISQAEQMKILLEEGLECECLSLDECVRFMH
jgi:MerR family redox-sensitive transcriptional activator SoxR